jgi:hypothetical protein
MTPQVTAAGSIQVSQSSKDIGVSLAQPALLDEQHHQQLSAVFNAFFAGTQQYQAQFGYHYKPWETTFSASVLYFNYGEIDQTDISGNIMGSFRPRDYAVQLSASRNYGARWKYGATLRFIASDYGIAHSIALALDMGLHYKDTTHLWEVGFVARNMGVQLQTYAGIGEDLPFDLQIGVTKRLKNIPLSFSLNAYRIHQFDIRYQDPANEDVPEASGFVDGLFRHFVFSSQLLLARRLELTLGYNYLRRAELKMENGSNGLLGFSVGAGVLFPKWHFRYARAYYQNDKAYNQMGLNFLF